MFQEPQILNRHSKQKKLAMTVLSYRPRYSNELKKLNLDLRIFSMIYGVVIIALAFGVKKSIIVEIIFLPTTQTKRFVLKNPSLEI